MRTIDADDFKAACKEALEECFAGDIEESLDARRIMGFVEFMLDKQPTVEPVKMLEVEE